MKPRSFFLFGVFLISAGALLSRLGWASTEDFAGREDFFGADSPHSSALPPDEAFVRTLAVLDHFGVPSEADSQDFFDDLQGVQTAQAIQAVTPILDMKARFSDFSKIETNSAGESVLRVFQDFRSKKIIDYEVRLGNERPAPTEDFHSRLLRAAGNSSDQPLAGLKIALDPGHMGGESWDARSGKFVHDSRGHQLSEGLMVLQTSLLLEKRLRALGAQVFITHRNPAPVSELPYESFDLQPYALRNLRERVLDGWFGNLLTVAAPGPALYQAFAKSADFQKLFAGTMRWKYFFLTEDLDARVRAISDFAPDLTLIIHMDTSDPPSNPNGLNPKKYNATKAYVAGGFFADEFGSRADRKFFGRHLLDARAWQGSVELSRRLVDRIHTRLGISLERTDTGNSVQIEPGIFARNLAVQRQLVGSVTSYLECLYYNDQEEFANLSRNDHSMEIGGKTYPYSERLNTLVESINEGVLQFVKNYH